MKLEGITKNEVRMNKQMKILFLCRSLHIGGVEKNLLLLTEEFKKKGHWIGVGAAPGIVAEMMQAKGAIYYEYSFSVKKPWTLLNDIKKLLNIFYHNEIDIIHSFSAASSVVVLFTRLIFKILYRKSGKKMPTSVSSVMGLQGSPSELEIVTHIRNLLVTLGAQRVFIISPEIGRMCYKLPLKKSLFKKLPVVGIRIPDSGNVSEKEKQDFKEKYGIALGAKVVSTIGRLDTEKSHDLFIRAASLIISKSENIQFIIAGKGRLKESLDDLIKELNLNSRVKLIGATTEVNLLLAISDVYVKPGVVNGFIGITVLEAQAMRIPVVAFDTVDVRIAITPGSTGVLVNAGDIGQLSEAIINIIEKPEEYADIVIAARQKVEAYFSIIQVAEGLLNAYSEEMALSEYNNLYKLLK